MEDAGTPTAQIAVDGLLIDLVKRRVTLRGEEVHLTPTEYDLVCAGDQSRQSADLPDVV